METLKSSKYQTSKNEQENLPNLQNLTNKEAIAIEESRGVLRAESRLLDELTDNTSFDIKYIKRIHKLMFEKLYPFAGKFRTVNISKNGFVFPAAQFLEQSMESFEKEVLLQLPHEYDNKQMLIKDIAKVHAELLFIHPFREGNGRAARILANLMAYKQGYKSLNFGKLTGKEYEKYVIAVQQAANMNYKAMEEVISFVFDCSL